METVKVLTRKHGLQVDVSLCCFQQVPFFMWRLTYLFALSLRGIGTLYHLVPSIFTSETTFMTSSLLPPMTGGPPKMRFTLEGRLYPVLQIRKGNRDNLGIIIYFSPLKHIS